MEGPMEGIQYVTFEHEDSPRSPRTPTWLPAPGLVTPFDLTKYFPISPPATAATSTKTKSLPPPPDKPLPWIWQCHLCRNRYALGVTRRCLYDGHYYCSGETNRPNLKRKRKGQACSSEFDYEGWEEYGDWRRRILKISDNPKTLKGCENCNFPSECRTPEAAVAPKKNKKSAISPVFVMPEPEQQADLIPVDEEVSSYLDEKIIRPSVEEVAAAEGEKIHSLTQACVPTTQVDRHVHFDHILGQTINEETESKAARKQKQPRLAELLRSMQMEGKSTSKESKRKSKKDLSLNLEALDKGRVARKDRYQKQEKRIDQVLERAGLL